MMRRGAVALKGLVVRRVAGCGLVRLLDLLLQVDLDHLWLSCDRARVLRDAFALELFRDLHATDQKLLLRVAKLGELDAGGALALHVNLLLLVCQLFREFKLVQVLQVANALDVRHQGDKRRFTGSGMQYRVGRTTIDLCGPIPRDGGICIYK